MIKHLRASAQEKFVKKITCPSLPQPEPAQTGRLASAPSAFPDFFTIFFTRVRAHCCKCLIEHPKLYPFFTKIHFLNGKVPDGRQHRPYPKTLLYVDISKNAF
jgi:hypothetical protein